MDACSNASRAWKATLKTPKEGHARQAARSAGVAMKDDEVVR